MNKFSSRLGFILTAVGSAVGMANVWGFPYKLQEGGLFFLIAYIFFIALFSYVGLSSEFAIGRIAETGTIGSYEKAFESKNKNKKNWNNYFNTTTVWLGASHYWLCSCSFLYTQSII